MSRWKRIAFLFPGQGTQYGGMGYDFYQTFSRAREVFEETDAILGRHLSRTIFEGPEQTLTETHNSQVAIYAVSMAILQVLRDQLPDIQPAVCAGFSLGEYSAVTAAGYLDFPVCLPLVEARGRAMSQACEKRKGGMAAIIGLSASDVEAVVGELGMVDDLWVANFNCPGQVVISGTQLGLEKGMAALKARGAKRALPLNVHGAFHSGLMREARETMRMVLAPVAFYSSPVELVMNVTGDVVRSQDAIRDLMVEQITAGVRWEQSMLTLDRSGVDLYIEIGSGRTLAGFNGRSGVRGRTVSVGKVSDLDSLDEVFDHVSTA
jgi:[acyl-carrier-protein] S-malonyltransferase